MNKFILLFLVLFIGICSVMIMTISDIPMRFRYPCQDTSNWKSIECKPPICTVDRNCPENVLGKKVIEELKKSKE